MARQRTSGIPGLSFGCVRDRLRYTLDDALTHYVDVEIHETITRDIPRGRTHPVRSMADRTGKAVVDVAGVLREAGVSDNFAQVVTLGAEGVGPFGG